jgi:hypothetical protein
VEEAAPSASGGAGPGHQVQLPLGGHVVAAHGVRRDAPARDRAHLPDLVHLPGAVLEHEGPEHPDAAVAAELGREVGRVVGDGPGGPEREPGDAVRLHAVGAAALGRGDERLRAGHAVAGRVEPPGHPAAGRGRRGHERHRQLGRRRVVGPVHGRAEVGQVAAGRERAVGRELLRRARAAGRGCARRRRRHHEEDEEAGRGGHGFRGVALACGGPRRQGGITWGAERNGCVRLSGLECWDGSCTPWV